MEMRILIIFCVIDDILKATGFVDDLQVQTSSAEIMTIAICACIFFGGNLEKARTFFFEYRYVKHILSKSQFNRRLHAINADIWHMIFAILAQVFKDTNQTHEYAADSFPVAVCDNIRISRSKIYKGKVYRGKIASKRRFFYGIKVHMIATTTGKPVEFAFAPGSYHDLPVFKDFQLDLPQGSTLFADSAFTDYFHEDLIKEALDIDLLVDRKSNSKRPHAAGIDYLISIGRKTIETTFSKITNFFPKKIHAVNSRGFELKVFCFILAYSFTFI